MTSHDAPAIGGASGSTFSTHSAWNPYSVLPASIKRRIDPKSSLPPAASFLTTLSIPENVANERLNSKYVQLEPPIGKESDWRKLELATRAEEKLKKKSRAIHKGDCGLIGRRKRKRLSKEDEKIIRYDSVVPIHHLWLGYMIEVTGLPILLPPAITIPIDPSILVPPTQSTSALLPLFPPKSDSIASDLKLNLLTLHAKMVKAEFIGCILCVKRSKNPSLVQLKGIVLQETQSTFKLVTAGSQIKIIPKKGTIFTFSLPLIVPRSISSTTTSRILDFDIFGDNFMFKSADRVNKKWKVGNSSGSVQLV